MALPAIAAVAGPVIGGLLQGAGQRKAADAQLDARNQARQDAFDRFNQSVDQAVRGNFAGRFGLDDIFGTVPEAALFNPLNFGDTTLDNVRDNIAVAPQALELKDILDTGIVEQDLESVARLVPRFAENQALLGDITSSLLQGELPQDVRDQLVRERAQLSGATGTPGGAGPATLRDLGLNSLQAQQQGASLFQQMLNASAIISPQGQRFNPASQLLDPANRVQFDILQRSLDQQSRQNANFLAASADPAASQLFNAQNQLGLVAAGLTQGAPSAGLGLQGIGAGISQGAGLLAGLLQANRGQAAAANGNFGGGAFFSPQGGQAIFDPVLG